MKKAPFCYSRVLLATMLAIVLVLTLTPGCRLIPGGGDDSDGPSAASISGKVLKSSVSGSMRSGVKPKIAAADLAGFVAVPGAKVWIEDLADDLRYHTTSDASGSYVINSVPPGVHRVVTSFFSDGDQVTMKCRSAELKVADTPEVVEVPDMALETARNIVTGQLRDTEGNFLPENTVLTLWGETFKVGKDGSFTSPPLPDSYSEAEILVQLPAGNGISRFAAPFVSDIVPAFMDLTVGASLETENNAPSATLKAYSGTELVSKTNPGNILTLVAVGADADSGDQTTLTATWDKTAGTFANGASDFEKHWTAPEFAGMATISVEVKDPRGATGRVFLPILIGIDNPGQIDSGRPTVTLSTETTESTDSEPFVVLITFNEAVAGFAIEDITVTNCSLSELTTVTASRVFTVKVTPLAAGEVKITVPENIANDSAGNKNTAGNSIAVTKGELVQIKSAAVTIIAPVLGALPQAVAAVETATNNADYSVSALAWSTPLTADGKFKAGQVYTATVTLTSKNSKKFQAAAFTPAVTGSTSVGTTTTTGAAIGNTVEFTVTYAVTGALAVSSIAVTTQPNGMTYAEFGNVLSLKGMVITATNNDGSTNEATFTDGTATGYVANPANGSSLTYATHDGTVVTVTHSASTKTASTGNLTILSDYSSGNIGTLRAVPAGTFQRDETPANTSTVSTFRMSQYEITRAQFLAIMGTDPSYVTCSSGVSDPVQGTNWYHAIAYCNKLSKTEGLTPVYSVSGVDFSTLTFAAIPTDTNATWDAATCNWNANGYRLPTEMEWMWAAMGADTGNPGATNTTGYAKAFAGSTGANLIGEYAWYSVNSSNKTHPAGVGKTANELGLFDMSGNVWEWCWDWYSDNGTYPNYLIAGGVNNYRGEVSGSLRVVRGGSFDRSADRVTVASRGGAGPSGQFYGIGFRVVRP
ncbi:MAG: SUMF1/EgtB/PvdO family nonheme iron enzyme [Candidatus Riflebacteria bacterium]|nr:SUMF1/EgtB/PvdO family nonheme iron enzyme [Candidatus Riflebacteria bacterium]